jgi:hypothetical protein
LNIFLGDFIELYKPFLLCPFAWRVWLEVYNWFGLVEVLPGEVGAMFLSFFRAFKPTKKVQKGIVVM